MKKNIIAIVAVIVVAGGIYVSMHKTVPGGETAAISTDTTGTVAQNTSTPIPESGTVTLGLGESASFHGMLITPTKVVEDSRCPAGVYCIQAGTVRLEVAAQTPVGTVTRTVKLGDSITLGSQKYTFSKVDPLKTSKPIDPKDYRFTVSVEKI